MYGGRSKNPKKATWKTLHDYEQELVDIWVLP